MLFKGYLVNIAFLPAKIPKHQKRIVGFLLTVLLGKAFFLIGKVIYSFVSLIRLP